MFGIGSTPPLLAKLGKSTTCHYLGEQTKKEGRVRPQLAGRGQRDQGGMGRGRVEFDSNDSQKKNGLLYTDGMGRMEDGRTGPSPITANMESGT
jgi:hypothetical protein